MGKYYQLLKDSAINFFHGSIRLLEKLAVNEDAEFERIVGVKIEYYGPNTNVSDRNTHTSYSDNH